MLLRFSILLFTCGLAAPSQSAPSPALLLAQCTQRHDDKTQLAGVNLTVPNLAAATWHKVRQRVESRTMPPPPLPGLSDAARQTLTAWIDITHPVWPEYKISLVPLVSQALPLFAAPAEFAFRAATGVAKRGADVAGHSADAPSPDAAHTSSD